MERVRNKSIMLYGMGLVVPQRFLEFRIFEYGRRALMVGFSSLVMNDTHSYTPSNTLERHVVSCLILFVLLIGFIGTL